TYFRSSPELKLSARVRGAFEKRPLAAILRDLADTMGVTIVIDNRARNMAAEEVSATFGNDTDLAGTLRVLTEMADLKVLLLDGTFYVTTQEHAETIRNEKRQQMAALKESGLQVDPLWPYQPEKTRGTMDKEPFMGGPYFSLVP